MPSIHRIHTNNTKTDIAPDMPAKTTPRKEAKKTNKLLNNNVKLKGKSASKPALKAADVLAYLQSKPEFLAKHSQALSGLVVPKKAGNVLSLHAAKAEKSNKILIKLKIRHRQLISAAAANAATTAAVHDAILLLIAAQTKAEVSKALLGPFRQVLGLAAVRLLWGQEHIPQESVVVGPISLNHKDIFGTDTARLKSCALLRLEDPMGQPLGLLALGSEELTHFHAGQGTDLLEFTRRVAQLTITRAHQLTEPKTRS